MGELLLLSIGIVVYVWLFASARKERLDLFVSISELDDLRLKKDSRRTSSRETKKEKDKIGAERIL